MKKQSLFLLFCITALHADNAYDNALIDWATTFAEVNNLIQVRYVNQLTPTDLEKAMERCLCGLSHLDAHSGYVGKDECNALMGATKGEFPGIGVALPGSKEQDEDFVPILETLPDGPADKGGVKPGDKIIEVDGELVRGMTMEEFTTRLRGEKESPVTLRIIRAKYAEPIDFTLKRSTIKNDPVIAFKFTDHNVYYILLSIFSEKSASHVEKILKKALDAHCNGIILDLRKNSGRLF